MGLAPEDKLCVCVRGDRLSSLVFMVGLAPDVKFFSVVKLSFISLFEFGFDCSHFRSGLCPCIHHSSDSDPESMAEFCLPVC
eukprot:COSAG03_NODE_21565_length_302_cov_1.507389_1_plen_81_part_10